MTREALNEFYKRTIVSDRIKHNVKTPDHLKIFKPEEKVAIDSLVDALKSGDYDLE